MGRAEVVFVIESRNLRRDLDVPLDITANDLVLALNQAYNLKIEVDDIKKCYLKSENPIAFLKGNKTLQEYGIRNGSVIYFT